jgi:methylenetetrahydrofolate reductase (NADPH)
MQEGWHMFDCAYLVELLTPKRVDTANTKEKLNLFIERYYRILDMRLGISVPDNPMGRQRFGLLEMIQLGDLPVNPETTVMNLNTFHTKDELDGLLEKAIKIGIRHLLVVRGDGGPDLSKLDPKSIGGSKNIATSIDLLLYINSVYGDKFITGCAYNHYNPMPFETKRLREKMDAGAKFVITQPVIGKDSNINAILNFGIPVVIEAWMSKNVDLLYKSVHKKRDEMSNDYDPIKNLQTLHEAYPDSCMYLSMLGFKRQWKEILPNL